MLCVSLPTGKKLKGVKILSNTSEKQSVRVGKISMTINWDSFEMFITNVVQNRAK